MWSATAAKVGATAEKTPAKWHRAASRYPPARRQQEDGHDSSPSADRPILYHPQAHARLTEQVSGEGRAPALQQLAELHLIIRWKAGSRHEVVKTRR